MSKPNYFDTYESLYSRMAELSEQRAAIGYHGVTPAQAAEREELTTEIGRLREQAQSLIPYEATGRNYTWDGKRV